MPFDYRNFQQKSRRYKSGKGHQKQSNYHAKGKQSIHQKNKYPILCSSKHSHQRNYNYNTKIQKHSKYLHYANRTYQYQDKIEWHYYDSKKLSIAKVLEHRYPDCIKYLLLNEFYFDIDDADLKVAFTKTKQKLELQTPKFKQRSRKYKSGIGKKRCSQSYNAMKNSKHKRLSKIDSIDKLEQIKKSIGNNLILLIDAVGENIFFDIICKKFLYPWEIVNLSCLRKEINCIITSYDANHSYFKRLFSDTDTMEQYISSIKETINACAKEEIGKFSRLIIV